MGIWIRDISASVFCSLLLIPSTFIGIAVGLALYFVYNNIMGLNIPDWINAMAPALIGGFLAGIAATYIPVKLLKPSRKSIFLSLPFIMLEHFRN